MSNVLRGRCFQSCSLLGEEQLLLSGRVFSFLGLDMRAYYCGFGGVKKVGL